MRLGNLASNPGSFTARGNESGYEEIWSRVVTSTSGRRRVDTQVGLDECSIKGVSRRLLVMSTFLKAGGQSICKSSINIACCLGL